MRIAVVGSCSGQGKTTLARLLAERMGGDFVEFDSLQHGPQWTPTPDDELRRILAPFVAGESWAIDTLAEKKVGRLIVDRVQLIIWLDLPPWVWLPRLIRRSGRRFLFREALWNGNRETLRGIVWDSDGVFPHAFRSYFRRRSAMAARLHGHSARLIRLCTVAEVDQFLQTTSGPAV